MPQALLAAAKAEGTLNVITLPSNWANCGGDLEQHPGLVISTDAQYAGYYLLWRARRELTAANTVVTQQWPSVPG